MIRPIRPIRPINDSPKSSKSPYKYASSIIPETWKVPIPEDLDTDFITKVETKPKVLKHYIPFKEFKIEGRLIICENWRGGVESVVDEYFENYKWSELKYDQSTVFLSVSNFHDVSFLKNHCDGVLYYDEKPIYLEGTKSHNIVKVSNDVEKTDINYNVDPNELIDIPNRMKSEIVNQLIKFRSKVLNREKQRRAENLSIERRRVRERIFQINKIDNQPACKYKEPKNDNLSEADYRNNLKRQDSRRLEKLYNDKLRNYNNIKHKKRSLMLTLEKLKNYENEVLNNKEKYMGYIGVVDRKNKNLEQELDEKNRLEMGDDSLNIESSPLDKNNSNINNNHEEKIEDISKLSIESLSKLNELIEKLIEKYLGMIDNELIKYLFNSLLENNLNYQDLTETLDEDANKFILELNEFISSQSTS